MHTATHNPLCIVVHNAAERRCWRERRFKRRENVQVPGWWAARPCALLEPAPADAFESRRPCHGATLKRLHLGHGQVRSSIACYATPCQALAQPRATLTGSCTIFAGYNRSSITSPTSRARASTGYQGVRPMMRSARACDMRLPCSSGLAQPSPAASAA